MYNSGRRFLNATVALVIFAGLNGCGIYSIRFDPPRQSPMVSRHPPLDLTLSLGETQYYLDGKLESADSRSLKQHDDIFIQRAQASRLVKAVLPRGSRSDLYFDELSYMDTAGSASVARSFYKVVAFFPALILPGVPYPWQIHTRDQIRIRGASGDTTVTLREYTLDFTVTLWTSMIWGLVSAADQGDTIIGQYMVDSISEAIERDYDVFKRFEAASGEGLAAPVEATAARGGPQASLDAAVVRIRTQRSVGSGFFVANDLIATNAHVVGGSHEIWISFSGGKEYRGFVVYGNEELDFALVRSPVQGTPLPSRNTPLVDGEGVMAVGFPQGRRLAAASTGTVRKIVECCIEHDALVAGGSSGGPLVDLNFNVVGINTALVKAKRDRKNETDRTWALKMSYILESLRQANEAQ